MKTLYYRLTLKEPTILTALQGEPNSAVSYDFIPGSVMRGFFIGAKMRQDGKFDPADEETHRLFFSNQTRFLNVYPVIHNRRSLPVPVSWQKPKYKHSEYITDSALNSTHGDEKLESVKGFAVIADGYVSTYKPKRILNIHTQRARRKAEEQQVYRYDALAPNQTFEGRILCQNDDDAATLLDYMKRQRDIHIGGARSAGYGHVYIDDVDFLENWQEVEHQLADNMVITFLSDVILRDENGEHSPTRQGLQKAFAQYDIHFTVKSLNLQTTLVGGFNRKWGLPLPQTPAIQRGSVIHINDVQGTEGQWEELVWHGIGERTNEGFGQIALNWQQYPKLQIEAPAIPTITTVEIPLSDDGEKMLSRFKSRLSATRIDPEHIKTIFTDSRYYISGRISSTQLSHLRMKIADELRQSTPKLNFLQDFLDDISGEKDAQKTGKSAKAKAAGKQFEQSRIDGKSLFDWLREPKFDFAGDNLDVSYRLRLIDAVLERAHKERTNKQEVSK